MVRTCPFQFERRHKHGYGECEKWSDDNMTTYVATKLFKIPKATLFKYVKRSKGVKIQTLGRNQLLSLSMKREKL